MFLGKMFLCPCTYQFQYIPACTGIYHILVAVLTCAILYPGPFYTYSNCANHVLTCTVLYSLALIRKIMYWPVLSQPVLNLEKSCTDLYRLVLFCTDQGNPVLTCTILYRYDEFLYWVVQSCTDLYQTGEILYWLVPACTNRGNPVLACTALYWYVLVRTWTYQFAWSCPGLQDSRWIPGIYARVYWK